MPTVQPLALPRNGNTVAAIDLGTSKLFCLIAELNMGRPRILGAAQLQAEGLKHGDITDLNQFSHCLHQVIDEAETSAGESARDIYLAFSGGNLSGQLLEGNVPIEPGPISNSVLTRALDTAETIARTSLRGQPKRELLHVVPAFYAVDGRHGVSDPRGIHADHLSLFANAVTMSRAARRDLDALRKIFQNNRTHILAAPWASALAVLDADEKNLGAIVIDIGAETTSVTEVRANALHTLSVIPTGGATLTRNIARQLGITLRSAEQIKTRHGHAFADIAPDHETVKVTPLGNSDHTPKSMPRAKLLKVLQPSLENILAKVREQLNALAPSPHKHLVFTGGGSLVPGLDILAEHILEHKPRLASPKPLSQLADLYKTPAHAVSVGTLLWATQHEDIVMPEEKRRRRNLWQKLASPPQRWLHNAIGAEF